MSITTLVLIPAKQAEIAQTTQYTVPALTKVIIDKFTGTNTTGGPVTLSINLVVSGGAAAATNLIVQLRTLAAGETYTFPEVVGHALAAGSFISTIASAATSITIASSGRAIT